MAHSENSDRPAKGFLKVSDIHTLYYEVYGKESGIPVLFLHGGPGAGFSDADQRFFDQQLGHARSLLTSLFILKFVFLPISSSKSEY